MSRTFLSGADLVLPDSVVSGRTIVIEGDRIVDLVTGPREMGAGEVRVDLTGQLIVPGFIDVHVHGVEGADVLDGADSVARVARALPRWGVAAFCPTSLACAPNALSAMLTEIAALRAAPRVGARVLPAHLESNFINPEYRGAQPLNCLRIPADTSPAPAEGSGGASAERLQREGGRSPDDEFTTAEIIQVLDRHQPDIGIVTLAPELDGALALVRALATAGTHVSIGHSGADFEVAQAAIACGARQATHLFNRMRPMSHRDPGLTGAVLASDQVAAELVCDGHHVHPAVMHVAIGAKRPERMMAITDGTAGSGLARGTRAKIGGHPITVDDVARLDDGTIAGSVGTMDRMFACLVSVVGMNLPEAALMCATTPARELGLRGHGVIAPGAVADVTVLDARLGVRQTWIGGELAFDAAKRT
jgi:N-acetylglucosamine-6-phosphate deacetylase